MSNTGKRIMPRIRSLAALLLAVSLTLVTETATASDAQRIDAAIPPDAVAIGRLDLHRVLASPLGAALFEDLTQNIDGVNWFLGTAFGFDLSQVDYLWFAAGSNNAGLSLLQGRYDSRAVIEKIRHMRGWRSIRYPGIPQVSAYKNDEGEPQLAAVLRDDLLAMGDREEMEKMLESWLDRQKTPGVLREGVELVASSEAGLAIAALDASVITLASQPGMELIERAWLEANLDEDLHLSIQTEVVDTQAALGVESLVKGLMLIVERHPDVQADPALLAAVQNTNVERSERALALKTTVPGALILAARARSVAGGR